MNNKKLKLSTLIASMLFSSSLSFAGVVEDTAITTSVKAKLLLEKDIPSTNIEVTTKDNEVFLKGTVATSLQADKAIELAASLKDVIDVDCTDLIVEGSTSSATDSLITAKVKGKITQLFENDKIESGYSLITETSNKEVHIHGTVAKSSDIGTIEDVVRKIKYVDNVKTNIQVNE